MSFVWPELKRLFITMSVLFSLISAVTLLGGWFDAAVAVGMVYGLVFTTLWFVLLATIVERACHMGLAAGEKAARRFMGINYAARYILAGVILVIPFLSPDKVNPWCVVISMLAPKLTYFAMGFFKTFKEGALPLPFSSLIKRLKKPSKTRALSQKTDKPDTERKE